MALDKKALKRMFPNLARELEIDESRVFINSVRTDTTTAEKAASSSFVHYNPDIIDFIRRCDSAKQAGEIISYMENRNEISKQYATKLRQQLRKKGLRSFGSKKESDYYMKYGEQ